jgi:hypothetical protein
MKRKTNRRRRSRRQRGGTLTNWMNKKLRGINRPPPSSNIHGTEYVSELIRSTESDEGTEHILMSYAGEVDWYTPRLGNNKTFLYMALQKKKSKTAAFLFKKYCAEYSTVGDQYLRQNALPYANNVVSLAVEQSSAIFDMVDGPIKNNILTIILHNMAKYCANTIFERDGTVFDRYNTLYRHLLGEQAVDMKNILTNMWPLKRSDNDRRYTKNVDLQQKIRVLVSPLGLDTDYILEGTEEPLQGFP